MKRISTFLVALALCCSAFAQTRTDSLLNILHDKDSQYVFVVSHRGDWRNAPENSLQAFQNCIDMGVDMIELDLKKTKDGQLILMHDYTIDRTTDGKGKPEDYTLEELRKFHLKNGMGRVTFHQIPTLEEALRLVKGKILVNIDKGYDYFKEAYDIMVKTNTVDQVIIKSGKPYEDVLKENGEVLNKVIYMPVVNLDRENASAMIDGYKKMKPVAIECNLPEYTDQTELLLKKVLSNGSRIWINSLWPSLNADHDDDRAVEMHQADESWGWILDRGATFMQTDRPALLIKYLKSKGRR